MSSFQLAQDMERQQVLGRGGGSSTAKAPAGASVPRRLTCMTPPRGRSRAQSLPPTSTPSPNSPALIGAAKLSSMPSNQLIRLPKGATLPVTVKVLEVFHVCPVRNITPSISFVPISLLNMFNSGGAVEQFDVSVTSNHAAAGQDDGRALSDPAATLSTNRVSTATVALRVRGRGRFGAYSSQRPLRCMLDSSDVEFSYDEGTGLVTINIPMLEREMYQWSLQVQV
ncbi:Raffinose synthase or seed imbibition protein Sip1 [Musa troglodytarum]|uniref:Raffinose synthase or seed imbibition protein Sip1 n=1 Tax=Musa troglodytarum TaxID=320322 RepID=A0A9E7FR28_9LILI|nr:Raffinose synthase or seed imbibition protein Sip1 [Musa troglodytarum]